VLIEKHELLYDPTTSRVFLGVKPVAASNKDLVLVYITKNPGKTTSEITEFFKDAKGSKLTRDQVRTAITDLHRGNPSRIHYKEKSGQYPDHTRRGQRAKIRRYF
jgi:hypothetical protein